MLNKFMLRPGSVYLFLLVVALVLMGCGSGRSSEQAFEPGLDQSALVSAYAADQVPAESKLDYWYAQQNRMVAADVAESAAAGDVVPAESKLDYRYAAQNGGLESSSASNTHTLDFWYARQNGLATDSQ